MGAYSMWIAQGFGILAVICFLVSYQVKSNRGLYVMQALGCVAFSVQFLLLDAASGCISQIFIIVRNMMLSMYNQWAWVRWKGWVPIFILLAVLVTYVTWDGPISLLPMVPMTAGTIALWTNNAGIIRLAGMTCLSPAWILYDILTGAYSAILNELIVIGSAIVSIIRYGWREMCDPDSEFQKK